MTEKGTDGRAEPGRNGIANVIGGVDFERAGHRRRDEEWLRAQLDAPAARFLLMWRGKHLVTADDMPTPFALQQAHLQHLDFRDPPVYLCEFRDAPWFVLEVPADREPAALPDGQAGFQNLRGLATQLEADVAALLAYAQGMVQWHCRHGFCGRCGSATVWAHGGHMRVCTNEACGEHLFPRIDPAIIVLVRRGDRVLLGRQPSWPEGVYSAIAGFVEHGESLEGAVAREVEEETNVRVTDVQYHSSQPWPFPSSIMLGFTARGLTEDIVLNDEELEDARWFSRDEIAGFLARGQRSLPARLSIAFRLVSDWYDADNPGALAALLARHE
ncbi:MAG: NAD(+) diphosphatase [Alphaproteobacteria bacterium]|nr:NAD(+) diphosphatase [Alphaproteobacteria bacterium]